MATKTNKLKNCVNKLKKDGPTTIRQKIVPIVLPSEAKIGYKLSTRVTSAEIIRRTLKLSNHGQNETTLLVGYVIDTRVKSH